MGKRLAFLGSVVLAVSAFADSAVALPFQISLADFSGSQTVIDFNTVANEVQVTSQFVADGVVFSDALYGMTNPGDTGQFPGNGGGVIASNWLYSLAVSAHGIWQ